MAVTTAGHLQTKTASMSLVNPILFSQRFNVSPTALDNAGLLDPFLNADTKLFIDPLLIAKSANPIIRKDGLAALNQQFGNVLDLVEASKKPGDSAWKGAANIINLQETAETCLGYGGSGIGGSSRPASLRDKVLATAKEILELGDKNPNIIPLMGLFEEGIGPDTISDMTTNLIKPALIRITSEFCKSQNIATKKFPGFGPTALPENPLRPGSPVLLVPKDILRDLPLATDWSDVSRVVLEIQDIRAQVNQMVGNITKASVTAKKRAVRRVALSSLKNLRAILRAVADASTPYSEGADIDGFYAFRKILRSNPDLFVGKATAPTTNDQTSLTDVVNSIVTAFAEMVEDNNLWELMWDGAKHKNERAAQLLFFSVANIICQANNIDISPETNAGGGPVDFKFSKGYKGRYIVEVKLSTGKVVHGYSKQIEVYKKAAGTHDAMLLVVDVGKMGAKLRTITRMKAEAEKQGRRASAIRMVDARKRASASRRK